jgi:hypothetical protein
MTKMMKNYGASLINGYQNLMLELAIILNIDVIASPILIWKVSVRLSTMKLKIIMTTKYIKINGQSQFVVILMTLKM